MPEIHKEKFQPFIDALLKMNQDINLVARGMCEEEFFAKHVYDSVKLLEFFNFSGSKTLLDIGSGGGIPGIPLAIALPDLKVTLFDATEKKMKAAKHISDTLKLQNIRILVGRTEEKAHEENNREKFDIVTARAVASLPTLLEYALPFVKIGGYFIAYKGKNYEEELANSDNALKQLGGQLIQSYEYILPGSSEKRVYLIFQKVKKTPAKYPRKIGTPKKSPL